LCRGIKRPARLRIMVSFDGVPITMAPILPLPVINACSHLSAGLELTKPRSGNLQTDDSSSADAVATQLSAIRKEITVILDSFITFIPDYIFFARPVYYRMCSLIFLQVTFYLITAYSNHIILSRESVSMYL